MTRFTKILVVAAAGLALAVAPALAQQAETKQQQQAGSRPAGGNPSTGTAVARPSGGGSSGAPSGGPGPAGPSGMSSGSSRPAGPSGGTSGSRGVRAMPRSGPAPSRGVSGSSAPNEPRPNREVPQYSRPRGNRPAVGEAASRPSGGYPGYSGYPGYPVYPSYPWYGYPGWDWGWGYGYPYYGGLGVGFFSYDPYWWGGGYSGGGYSGGGYSSDQYTDTGQLRLKVKPRNAQVFVDGYYVGVVDEFDGTFQRLRLETGGHRVELRLDGYLPVTFDVLIPLGETITYRGELRPQ